MTPLISRFRPCLLAGLLVSSAPTYSADTISTAELTSSLMAPACVDYSVGLCVFVICYLFVCEVETSTNYGHYNPDLVVSAYNSHDPGNPWTEARSLYGETNESSAASLSSLLGGLSGLVTSGGNFTPGTHQHQNNHQNMLYKEVDAIGHPALSVLNQLSSDYMCPSDATAFQPYHLSGLDVSAWRWQIPESVYPQSLVPGLREVGTWPLNTWGNIYPRSGFSTQSDEAKMAAVIAQRSADIVTHSDQAHVYVALGEGQDGQKMQTTDDGTLVWAPGAIKEGDPKTGHWQMLVPNLDNRCEAFGENDTVNLNSWGGGKVSEAGNYAWTLWRPYECCEIRGVFLASFLIHASGAVTVKP